MNYGLQSICLYADGIPVGGNSLKLDFTKANGQTIARAYTNLFLDTGKWNVDAGSDLNRADFINGSIQFTFLETNFSQHGEYLSLVKNGNVTLDVQFKNALTGELYLCLVYNIQILFFQYYCHFHDSSNLLIFFLKIN